jgi:ubiquinone/menaquinone biosynthesis C-methylase UbiE
MPQRLVGRAFRDFGETEQYGQNMEQMSNCAVTGDQFLRCPLCAGRLGACGGGLECSGCGNLFGIDQGVIRFAARTTDHGELSQALMSDLLGAMRSQDWKAALMQRLPAEKSLVTDLIERSERAHFVSLLSLPQLDVALDFGAGYCGVSAQLAAQFKCVIALDSGLQRLQIGSEIARQKGIENILTVHHAEADRLPLPDQSVDLVTMIGVFEYLPTGFSGIPIENVQRNVLSEIARILRPGGQLYLGTKNRFGWTYLLGGRDHNNVPFGPALPRWFADWLTRFGSGKPYRIIVDSLPRYRALFRVAGFDPVNVFAPIPGYQFPSDFVPLVTHSHEGDQILRRQYSGAKRLLIRSLYSTGIYDYVVPQFAIVATKL